MAISHKVSYPVKIVLKCSSYHKPIGLYISQRGINLVARFKCKYLPEYQSISRPCWLYKGRTHSAVHSVNNGPGESLVKLCKASGCSIQSGSKVARALKKEQDKFNQWKRYQISERYQRYRNKRRQKLFKLHESHQEENHYIKAKPSFECDQTISNAVRMP